MDAVGTIVKVVHEIVKAAETARQNRRRCLDLADRARTVGDILREDPDSTTRMPPLERLKAALDDALELVESQRRSGLGIPKLITSRRTAARFQDVETRITACVVDLGLAEQIAARRRDHRANHEAAPVQEQKPPPPPQQQQGKDAQSLLHGYLAQAQSAQEALNAQYLMQANAAQGYLAKSTQEAKDAQSFLQSYLVQSAQQSKDAQSYLQGYLAQSAQDGKVAQSFLQGYLGQSAPQQGQDLQSSLLQDYLAQLQPQQQQQQSMFRRYG